MPESPNSQPRLTLLLLQEAIWRVEDRLHVILESVADLEAEALRLKRLSELHSKRLEAVEQRIKASRQGGSESV